MYKRITALLLALVVLLSLFSCQKNDKDDDGETPDNSEVNPLPVMATENYEITVSMMTYYFNAYYRSFVNNNKSNLSALGLDPSKPLSSQRYSEEYTWQDYFLFSLSDNLKQQLLIAEDAKKNGFELSDKDHAEIEAEIKKLDDLAMESNNATSYIIQSNYGECVNEATIRKCLQLSKTSMLYTGQMTAGYSFNDIEVDEYFKAHTNDILSFSYIRYQVDTDDQDAVVSDFSKCNTEEDFVAMIKKYASEKVYDADEEYIEKLLDECYVYGASYNESSDFAKWAFDSKRKANDIYINKVEGGNVLVAMALPASEEAYSEVLWRDITPLHNIKSILFSEDDYENAADAAEKANEVLDEINGGASFDEKMKEYSGGSTSNMVRGNAPDAIEDWVFDEKRTEGELGIITINGTGSYLIQMQADGAMAWKYFVLDALTEETFEAHLKKLEDTVEMKLNNDALKEITPITIS